VSTKHRISPTPAHQVEVALVAVVVTTLAVVKIKEVIKEEVVATVSGGPKYDLSLSSPSTDANPYGQRNQGNHILFK
jgi:hypothetical protein